DIDYDGFRRFLDAFLDCETPIELAQHLFVSFLKANVNNGQQGKTLNQMAAISSTAACAPVTAHTKGSLANINSIVEISPSSGAETTTNVRSSFVDKLHHGITDKLHSLSGHLTHDASKTGCVHPMVTVTPSPMAAFQNPTTTTTTNASIANNNNANGQNVGGVGGSTFTTTNARCSTDSSPSHSQTNHSQMSRNSSKKSNNSVNCKIDGKWILF
ncbi:Diacylglycerol kinase 1, partial [Lucilia cuprina]